MVKADRVEPTAAATTTADARGGIRFGTAIAVEDEAYGTGTTDEYLKELPDVQSDDDDNDDPNDDDYDAGNALAANHPSTLAQRQAIQREVSATDIRLTILTAYTDLLMIACILYMKQYSHISSFCVPWRFSH
jgi:hypothetical protein